MTATLSHELPAVLRATTRSLLTVAVLGTSALGLQAWITAPHIWQPAGLAAAHVIAPFSAVLVILAVPAGVHLISSPKRAFRDALVLATVAGVLLAIAAGEADLVMLSAITLIALVFARRLWPQLSDRHATARGWILLGGAGTALAALFLLDQPTGIFLTVFGFLLVAAAVGGIWGLLLLVRNAPLPPQSDQGSLHAVYAQHASAGVSPFALMNDKRWFWSRDRKAFLAYGARAGVAVVLGPGIGPKESVDALYREFRAACYARGWKLGFYQVSTTMAQSVAGGTHRAIGSEAIVDLTRLTLDGPTMAKLRHEVSRGKSNGVAVRILPKSELTPDIREAMATLAESWSSRHALGEMSFSVGRRGDQPNAPTIVGLASDSAGTLVAYCTWLALAGSRGMVLDEIRRTSQTPAGAMDLLLYSCMEQFKSHATWASLGLAPFACARENRLALLVDGALHRLGIASVSASLVAFKGKFQPQWEPRYMVAERPGDWPAFALATFLLHYPDFEQRIHRVLPQLTWRREAQIAVGVAGALLAVGLTGALGVAAQGKAVHSPDQAHLVVAHVTDVLPSTGIQATPSPLAGPRHTSVASGAHQTNSIASRDQLPKGLPKLPSRAEGHDPHQTLPARGR